MRKKPFQIGSFLCFSPALPSYRMVLQPFGPFSKRHLFSLSPKSHLLPKNPSWKALKAGSCMKCSRTPEEVDTHPAEIDTDLSSNRTTLPEKVVGQCGTWSGNSYLYAAITISTLSYSFDGNHI